ncbi:hypothetical protein B5V01_33440 [Mesorhizobium erdmanii]|uniref:Uncharacterized protein n=2 Tax=Mesorhizobium TaxID=68287 RepID=A0A3M9XG75_9HYPH|nr:MULTISPECIES: hypothetical protein [Mesorhizobium]RNJ47033.1 hypothetical protein DNR46_03995 [Mesorhizobium japonicum]RXT33964.1 hypothetical protein B5V01_33440 [Mesorhizobium erdmanii]
MARNANLSSTVAAEQKLSALTTWIEASEETLKQAIAGSERRMLLEVIRAIDSIGYFRAFAPGHKVTDLPGYVDVCWLGASRVLSYFLPAAMVGPGAIFARTTPELSLWASGVLYQSGLVSHLKRLIDFVRYDLATLELAHSGAIRFVITADDFEAVDREAINWFGRHTKNVDRPFLDALAADQGKWIVQQLQSRVRKDEMFGIGYSSCRELEEYFEAQSQSHARSLPGNDALPDDCKVGPLTFGQYRSAMVTGMARCLKHTAFVDTLLIRKDPPAIRDILTIYKFDHQLREEWGGLHGLRDDEADILLEVMGISPADGAHLKSIPDCPQALLIRGGDDCWHSPVFGGLNCPFPWMNRKLQRMFRPDWDRAVNLREAAFRDDLRALFPEPRFFMPQKTHPLRDGRRMLTDIDATIFDRNTGTLSLFQLKWQDSFEASLRERASRQTNLTREGNEWVEVVSTYCTGLNGTERAFRLGLPQELASNAKAMRLFVLTRNGARFSGGEVQDSRAAWFSWFDLLRQCHGLKRPVDPLTDLWKIGRRSRRPRKRRGVQSFELNGVRIEIVMA